MIGQPSRNQFYLQLVLLNKSHVKKTSLLQKLTDEAAVEFVTPAEPEIVVKYEEARMLLVKKVEPEIGAELETEAKIYQDASH